MYRPTQHHVPTPTIYRPGLIRAFLLGVAFGAVVASLHHYA